MKRLGPELKMPDVKPPAVIADLYYDLRDRRLLPLVALVVVAIAAVPFLLGDEAETVPPPSAGKAAAEAAGSGAASASSLTVVEAKPGLRDYHKRLKGQPTDPFVQQYTAPAGGGGGGSESGGGSGTTVETTTTTVTETPSGGGGGSGSGSGSGAGQKPGIVFFAFAIDARISKSGGKPQEPFVAHRVLPQTPLPGAKAPVVTYMGPSREGAKSEKVLMLVSGKVRKIDGEARCVSRDEVCRMLEMRPGFPVTFAYGPNDVYYTIKVLKVALVVTGRSELGQLQNFSK